MTPQEFIAKWGPGGPAHDLNERQGAQPHFMDLCQLLGVPTPGTDGEYLFEQGTLLLGEARGFADVFMRNHFAWENKAPGRNLDAALKQLLTYSLALDNPPLLVVCDRLTIRIHTQFNGHPSEVHTVLLAELEQPEKQALLRRLWSDPESFRPKKTSRDITEAAAKSFATLAEGLRKRGPGTDEHADEVAHFLTQCLFCFFAEDVGLLPGRMFEGLVNNKQLTADRLSQGLTNLFTVMRKGGLYGNDDIPWFNGGLFKKVKVPTLTIMEVTELRNAASLNWSAIDVSIFGTLFERGLDPAKRSQLGAHYTDPATILRIVEPVLTRPLLQKWELVAQGIRALMAKSVKRNDKHHRTAQAQFVQWLEQLSAYRVLDPACGSGNFLFLGLKALKDIEHKSHLDAANLGLDRQADLVTGPHNVLGIELNEYAAELARVTVWIGELQWRIEHGYDFKTNPVLEPLDHIECRDALLVFSDSGAVGGADAGGSYGPEGAAKSPPASAPPPAPNPVASEAPWPKASVVIGNPPFLGDRKMIRELGEAYTVTLRKVYADRVPGGADLVCYWFEKSRKAIEANGLGAAGLVSTNSIRGGANRKVLDAIGETTRIFEAWGDEGWVNDGAAVRVSLVAFGHADQPARLDGAPVAAIAADLSAQDSAGSGDLTTAAKLSANAGASFIGTQKNGPFDVPRDTAVAWLVQPNPHGQSNAQVLRPWANGLSVTRRPENLWVIDFDKMSESDASLFELPFAHAALHVKPTRLELRRDWHRLHWWCHGDPRPAMKLALAEIPRQIVSPRVSKHRVFAWFCSAVLPDSAVVAIARADDTTFGILHSRFHELWSLRMGTSLEDRPRYTPTTCFETFPFPEGLTPADTAHQRTEVLPGGAVIPAGLSESNMSLAQAEYAQAAPKNVATAIAQAAKRLNDLRDNWLNPPEWTERLPEVVPLGMTASPYPDRIVPKPGFEKDLAQRTLTKLYNQRPAWLHAAHEALDAAVAAAYGWTDYTATMPDEDILKRLLALNLARSKP
ncbi:class I SAM-dependent DNA methyltransferase [Acidovorax sp.]|uniref:class I SAM-dependent DNA methyltransferase n=1 Tax=Acidovorax sp. TaxID=1872122 RepID=UPI002ACEBD22|nr:DNA methyltransferase [Acidovorax sp.]MDZ7862221.1 type IIL restriction-modification enzyme MmeI [Acidovorax sp.]